LGILQEEESTHTAILSLSRSDTSESSLWREVEEGREEKRDGTEGREEMDGRKNYYSAILNDKL
jgi:hypothetical protein